MSRFLNKRFARLTPYTPGEQPQNRQYVKLNTNESPFPPAPSVLAALSPDNIARLNLYPDPAAADLCAALGRTYGLSPAQVIAGNGSDELLAFCFQAFCGSDKGVCFPAVSYGFYPVYAALYGLDAREIPLREDFSIDPADYVHAGCTIVIANPNAPTGRALTRAQVESILRANPDDVVVMDEAYVDFGAESAVSLIPRYENLVVVQTFSKSRNLAGMRLGFAMGQEDLVRDLNTMKFSFNPYNLDRLACLAGVAALADTAYFTRCTKTIQATRSSTVCALTALGFGVLPSTANFVFAKPPMGGKAYYAALKERGVLVRWFDKPGLRDYVRISIGSEEQMEILLQKTKEIMEGIV